MEFEMIDETFELDAPRPTITSGAVEKLVDVHLSEADYNNILKTKSDFGKIVNFLVSNYAQGGIMVQPSKISYLTELTGLPIVSQVDIVDVVENSVRRGSAAGDLRVVMDVDPAFAPALEDLAQAQGRTVNEIVKECLEIVLQNSWLYSIELTGGSVPLLAEQRRELELIMGCEVTSESLVEFASEAAASGVRRGKKKPIQLKKESSNAH